MDTQTITAIKRLKSSVNGNPRFRLTFASGASAITQSDISQGYEIGNPGYREGDTVGLEYTRAGRIARLFRA